MTLQLCVITTKATQDSDATTKFHSDNSNATDRCIIYYFRARKAR